MGLEGIFSAKNSSAIFAVNSPDSLQERGDLDQLLAPPMRLNQSAPDTLASRQGIDTYSRPQFSALRGASSSSPTAATNNKTSATQTVPVDEQTRLFKTEGGTWRTKAGEEEPHFYPTGTDTSGTTLFDREYYQSTAGEWIHLNAHGAMAHRSDCEGKPRPEDISNFDWKGWERVDVAQVPGEYNAEGKSITFQDPSHAQDERTVLRRYLQQNVIGTDKWMGDVDSDERAVDDALSRGVRVEITERGRDASGATIYDVHISQEDLGKLRAVKAAWQAKRNEIAGAVERGRQETDRMFTDQGRVLWNSGVNIVEGTINAGIDALRSQGGVPPVIPDPFDPLHVNFSGAKFRYESEMMRRNMDGKVDGAGIKAGEFIEAGVTIGAPLVVGEVFTPKAAPQTLKSLGALPEETVAATQATKTAGRVFREDDFPYSAEGAKPGRMKSHIDAQGNLRPANPEGNATISQHIRGSEPMKSQSPYTSFKGEHGIGRPYGDQTIKVDIQRLAADIKSGKIKDVEIITNKEVMQVHEQTIREAQIRYNENPTSKNLERLERARMDRANSARDNESLIKGVIPKEYLTLEPTQR